MASYGLEDRDSKPDRAKLFCHNAQTASEAHPASYPTGTGIISYWVKRPTHLHLVPRLRMRGAIP
jgi:hypothetical protein